MEKWIWTDELVKEFVKGAIEVQQSLPNDVSLDSGLRHFKKSKQPYKGVGFEILCFVDDKNNYWMRKDGTYHSQPFDSISESHFLNHPEVYKIRQVRRIEDNEVFSIGDGFGGGFKITSFKIENNKMMYECNNNGSFYPIETLRPIAKPVPLFTTEDGKEIYKGMEWWSVWDGTFEISKNYSYPDFKGKRFSTMEATKEYILMNKPVLSLKDLLEVWGDGDMIKKEPNYYTDAPLFNNFKRKAQTKINGL